MLVPLRQGCRRRFLDSRTAEGAIEAVASIRRYVGGGQAQANAAAQAQAAAAQQKATYNKAFTACMEGKGYTAK